MGDGLGASPSRRRFRATPPRSATPLSTEMGVKIELATTYQADLAGVTQGCFHLSFAGHQAGIAIIDSKLGQGTRFSL